MHRTVRVRVRAGLRLLARRMPWPQRARGCGARYDAGMVTSEYAMGLVAAVAFAAVLYKVVTSGPVGEALQALVNRALSART
ncbi:DUF4244 domain-containing protein [Streptomyces sp. MS06]|uniref:DUF4244 domain-containing protein n=1 Tax=Streptomyces sp. MS06 TaxID=3385974 RepID=UPI0039A34389